MNTNDRSAGEFASWDRGGASGGFEPGPWLPASPKVESADLDPCLCGDKTQGECAGGCNLGAEALTAGCPHGCPNDSFDACDRNGSRLECNSSCCPDFTERPTASEVGIERLINTGVRVGVMQARLAATDLRVFVAGIAALPMDGEHQCNPDYCPDECGGEDDPACQGEPFDLTNDDAVETLGGLIDGARACLRELAALEAKLPGMGGAGGAAVVVPAAVYGYRIDRESREVAAIRWESVAGVTAITGLAHADIANGSTGTPDPAGLTYLTNGVTLAWANTRQWDVILPKDIRELGKGN